MELLYNITRVSIISKQKLNFTHIDGQCTALLGKIPSKSYYIDSHNKKKGFVIEYIGGDLCSDQMIDRKVKFQFNCDKSIDFEVRSFDEAQSCVYTFQIYTN